MSNQDQSISPSNSSSSLSNLSLSLTPSRLSNSSGKSSSSIKSKVSSGYSSPKLVADFVAEKEGVIYIKLPTETRSNTWKVWTKKYSSIKPDLVLGVESVVTSALVTVGKSEKSSLFSEDVMFKKWFTPENSVVFRSKSRTQAYSFTICVDSEPVIHMAAGSETETQTWIETFRSILWPSSAFTSLEKTVGSLFEVSIIDNEFSYRAGLLGAFGNLQITTKKAVLLDSVHGSKIQEWELSTVGFKILPQPHRDDRDKIITMIADNDSSTGYGTIIMYCKEATKLIERVHGVRQMFKKNSYKDQFRDDIPDSDSLNESFSRRIVAAKDDNCNHDNVPSILVSDAATIEAELKSRLTLDRSISDPWLRKIIEGQNATVSNSLPSTPVTEPPSVLERPNSLDGQVPKTQAKVVKSNPVRRLFAWKNMSNIPESMLDSSMTSNAFKTNCKTISETSPLDDRNSNPVDNDEEDSDDLRTLHEAIAEEAEAEEFDGGEKVLTKEKKDAIPSKPPRKL